MLKINDLTKVYVPKKGVAIAALSNVSVDFGDRGLVFLLGKSGSGKTTMLNLIGGLDAPTSGELVINGRSSASFSESDYDSYRNTYVGFVFQEYNLLDSYTVGVNIGLALELQGKQAERSDIDAYLIKVGLVDGNGRTLFDRRVNELSGGQRQRVAIARALVKEPEIILADEPTGSLDRKTGGKLYELLKELAKDKLVIIVSHDTESAEKYGDRILQLKNGVVISDTAAEPETAASETTVPQSAARKAGDCVFIRSKLPAKRSFMIGAKTLLGKKFRLVLSLLLSLITFVAFGFALTASTVNELDTELQTAHDNGRSMVTLAGYSRHEGGRYYSEKAFTNRQQEQLIKYNNDKQPINVFSFEAYPYENHALNIYNYTGITGYSYNAYTQLGFDSLRYLAELDPNTGETDAMLSPDKRFADAELCRLPQAYDEIAITDLCADMFIQYGYKEYVEPEEGAENGDNIRSQPVEAINKPDDLIGKTIGGFKICGVYSTGEDINEFKVLSEKARNDYKERAAYNRVSGAAGSIVTYGFVRKGYLENYPQSIEVSRVLYKLSGDILKERAMIDALTYKVGSNTYTTVKLSSGVSGLLWDSRFLYEETFLIFMVILIVVFTIFAVILTSNFLSASLHFNRRDLGILRALGARKRDVAVICLAESLLKAGAEFVISVIALFGLCLALNAAFSVSVFIVSVFHIAMLLPLIFGVSALSTIFPIRRLMKKRPVDIINNK